MTTHSVYHPILSSVPITNMAISRGGTVEPIKHRSDVEKMVTRDSRG